MTRWTPAIVLVVLAPLLHAEIVSPVIPDGLGVNIHFTDPKPGEMKQIAEDYLGGEVIEVVIMVLVYFDDV